MGASTGCASIFSGGTQDVRIKAYPEDAKATVNGTDASNTGTLKLARGRAHVIEFSKSGFESRRVQVKQDLNGWFLANLLLGPFFWVGMLVDAMTGSLNELSPNHVTVTLDPVDPNAPRKPDS